MSAAEPRQRRNQERRANIARRFSRLLAQSLRSEDFTRMISEKQKTLTAAKPQGSPPITPEPAPSPRLWASAWARPLADAITLTRTRKYHASKGTFLPCWKRGHFHFALTKQSLFLRRSGESPYYIPQKGDSMADQSTTEPPDAQGVIGSGELRSSRAVRTGLIIRPKLGIKAVQYAVVEGVALFEGDIVLGTDQEVAVQSESLRAAARGEVAMGVVITGSQYRWPNCSIPYDIDPGLPNQNRVTDAIA